MYFHGRHLIAFLLGTLLTCAFADSLKDISRVQSFEDERDYPSLITKRAFSDDHPSICRTLCSGCCSVKPERRRSISPPVLEARVLENPGENVESRTPYIVSRFSSNAKLTKIYDGSIWDSTSVWKPFMQSRTRAQPAFEVGLSHLCGCTTLVVVSRNGIYASHHFEDQAFGGIDNNPPDFQKYVVDFLQGRSGNFPSLFDKAAGLTKDNAQVFAYILTPMKEGSREPLYSEKIPQMVEVVKSIVQATVQVRYYDALEGGRENGQDINPAAVALLDSTAFGRVLFQYDPAGEEAGTNEEELKRMRLFFEATEILTSNPAEAGNLGSAAGVAF